MLPTPVGVTTTTEVAQSRGFRASPSCGFKPCCSSFPRRTQTTSSPRCCLINGFFHYSLTKIGASLFCLARVVQPRGVARNPRGVWAPGGFPRGCRGRVLLKITCRKKKFATVVIPSRLGITVMPQQSTSVSTMGLSASVDAIHNRDTTCLPP